MYPKRKCQELVDSIAPKVIDALDIHSYRINIEIIKSTEKPELLVGREIDRTSAISFLEKRTANIFIFWDKQHGKTDTIGTIVHELLHVKMHSYHKLISKKNENKAHHVEENTVRCLEKLFVKYGKVHKTK